MGVIFLLITDQLYQHFLILLQLIGYDRHLECQNDIKAQKVCHVENPLR